MSPVKRLRHRGAAEVAIASGGTVGLAAATLGVLGKSWEAGAITGGAGVLIGAVVAVAAKVAASIYYDEPLDGRHPGPR
jgi:hypothetical protein